MAAKPHPTNGFLKTNTMDFIFWMINFINREMGAWLRERVMGGLVREISG